MRPILAALARLLDSRLRGNDGHGVDSRLRGNDESLGGDEETGLRPVRRRLRADWIPAYAGMAVMGWIPAFAGMTVMGWIPAYAGMAVMG